MLGVARELGEQNQRFASRLRDSDARLEELSRRASEAERSKAASEEQRARVEQERGAARRELFLLQVEEAERALRNGRLAQAAQRLGAIPEEHAGWEQAYLRLSLELAARRVEVHEDEVLALARSGDGQWIATGSDSAQIRVWPSALDEPLLQVDAGERVRALALDFRGEVVAASNARRELIAWSVASGAELARWEGELDALALAVLPDGRGAVVGFRGGAVAHWRFGSEPQWLAEHDDDVNCVAVSASGDRFATTSDDHSARVYGGADFGQVRALEAHTDWVVCAAFGASDSQLATGSYDGTVRVWDVEAGVELDVVQAAPNRGEPVVSVALGNGSELAFLTALGQGGQQRGRELVRFELPLAPLESVTSALLFEAEERVLFATGDGALRSLELDAPAPFARLDLGGSPVRSLALSDERVLAGCFDGRVRVLDAASGQRLHELNGSQGSVIALAVSLDGRLAASGGRDRSICLWDLETGELVREFESPTRLTSLALEPGASQLLRVGRDGSATLWETATGATLHEAPGLRGLVFAASACLAADRFAWVGDAGTLRLWDAASGERLVAMRERDLGRVEALALSRDGARAAVLVGGNRAAVFDLASETSLGRMLQEGRSLRVLAFDPSGTRLVTGSVDGSFALWDCATGTKLIELAGGTAAIQAVAFSPDGARIVLGTGSGELQVWETDAQALAQLRD